MQMIKPICLYGCELWVPSLGKSKAKTSIEDRYDDFHCEKSFYPTVNKYWMLTNITLMML